MVTIPKLVEELIKDTPFLEENLEDGLINLSALARKLKPQIEKKLYKTVQIGAVIMALKRLEKKKTRNAYHFNITMLNKILQSLGDITVRSNIIYYTYANSPTLIEKQRKIMQSLEDLPGSFLTITSGVFETAIFASNSFEDEVEKVFSGENLKDKVSGLSSITIVIPKEAIKIPGVYYSILKKLVWQGINFIEVVSSHTELTLFLEKNSVGRAFLALKN